MIRRSTFARLLRAALAGAAALAPAALAAQGGAVTAVAGPEYEGGPARELLLGKDYRDLWVTPVRVPVLDLKRFAGGLTPVRRGGGLQTLALRLKGANGCEYNFRSVNKELTPALLPDAQNTVVDWLRQDQTSAQLPGATSITGPLARTLGILHVQPELVVMPDAPRLGEFRSTFAGMLGTIELHPEEAENGCPAFAGADEVESTEDVLEEVEDDPSHRVDARAFLRARLLDLLIGDWDRHPGNWRWARYDRGGTHWWVPIPEDRDYAFVDYDGLLLRIARLQLDRLVRFEEENFNLTGLMSNSMELNRRILGELPRPAWDSAVVEFRSRLTDAAIDSAVRQLPPEYYAREGAELAATLRARRDRMPEVAARYYRLLAQEPEAHGTDKRDRLDVERLPDGRLDVRLSTEKEGTYFRRVFHPEETSEVRVFLHGKDDHAVVHGSGPVHIGVRIVGGKGDDLLEDRSRGGVAFYDSRGENRFVTGRGTKVVRRAPQADEDVEDVLKEDRGRERRGEGKEEKEEPEEGDKPQEENWNRELRNQQQRGALLPVRKRDWGVSKSLFTPRAGWVSNAGPVIGIGPTVTRYGFLRQPHQFEWKAGLLYAPLVGRWGVEAKGDLRMEASPAYVEFLAQATQIAVGRFHGFGNETEPLEDESDAKVWERRLALEALYHLPLGRGAEIAVGPVLRYTDPEPEAGTPAGVLRPRGIEPFGQVGARTEVEWDLRDSESYPRRGFYVRTGAAAFPAVWDGAGAFGTTRAEWRGYFSPSGRWTPVLALRAGGMRAWGEFPFQEAAFVGGRGTLRGFPHRRFLGDGALYGSAELRAPLTRAEIIVKGDLGVLALADVGRVFVDGEESDTWHSAWGGGLWFSFLSHRYTVNLTYARGEEGSLYLGLGFPF
jgi:hypothetical protein